MAEIDNRNGQAGNAPTGRPRFEVGDTVIDRDDDDASTAQVLNPDVGRADQVERGNSGKSVSDENKDYPADDRVVRVAFGSDLRILPEDGDGTIAEQVERYVANWGVEIRTYDYPASRLVDVAEADST